MDGVGVVVHGHQAEAECGPVHFIYHRFEQAFFKNVIEFEGIMQLNGVQRV